MELTELANGTYWIEVTLTGGSGKASVESPAALTVEDGTVQATIIWSSPNYDYMQVDGVDYYPVNEEGNSTFVVAVPAMDEEISIQAETTAMSAPHLIDYTLYYDSATLRGEGSGDSAPASSASIGVAVAVIIALAITAVMRTKGAAK